MRRATGRDPLALIDEVRDLLGLDVAPLNWPVGMGKQFQGVYDREEKEFLRFERSEDIGKGAELVKADIEVPSSL